MGSDREPVVHDRGCSSITDWTPRATSKGKIIAERHQLGMIYCPSLNPNFAIAILN